MVIRYMSTRNILNAFLFLFKTNHDFSSKTETSVIMQ